MDSVCLWVMWVEEGYFCIENFKLFIFCNNLINLYGFLIGDVFFYI